MRLFEAIIEANHRAAGGDAKAGLRPDDFADSLPVVALTCIDARLNPLLPEALGIPEEHFIWLRNAGNIVTGSMSSTMRSLALACAVKGGKEIAILGHTDCKVRRVSTLELTDAFRKIGIDRARLPDNLNEFFGLFASESQNILRGVEFTRQSPLIGPKIPVHGLLLDIQTGRLEWVVNGYQSLATAASAPAAHQPSASGPKLAELPDFHIGGLDFPEVKIGELSTPVASILSNDQPAVTVPSETAPKATVEKSHSTTPKFDPVSLFKIMGEDRKIYGPVSGEELEKWLAEDRVTLQNLAQKVGYKEWKNLAAFALGYHEPPKIPLPPTLKGSLHLRPPWSRKPGK